ncbi:MAG: nucleoside triphosphate pyrophosphohydrolase, partial [Oscillospiraceae bacterium]
MVNFSEKRAYDCQDLREIVRILRSPGGCSWDGAQTHQSIRRNFLEESYEVAEAIDEGSPEHLREELGDVLLQVVFHASIEEDAGRFNLDDVADGVCKKLIYRHPHVFGDVAVHSTDEILSNWEELKKKEKGQATQADAVDAVARTLPALWRAEKMKKKAAKAGFDWRDISGALDKLSEELDELRAAALSGDGNPIEELGDLLFAAAAIALPRVAMTVRMLRGVV